ncbi:MAG TPA: sugar phosphate nucleotidyltransferase [Candidatus Dormibacteraeota bacterium]|nr:sugar phosphate nucleotidyltransferase [Candidatus Dormibacteraeota bacterium]
MPLKQNPDRSTVSNAQAVILAGGLGTRMRPVTETIPKPMISVVGKPFLEHQLELLHASGIDRSLLLVAYLGERIEEYFGDGAKFHLHIAYSYEPTPLGTGGALKNAEEKLQNAFVLLNGDTYLAIDYSALLLQFAILRCSALIVAYKKPMGNLSALPADHVPNNLLVDKVGRVEVYRKRDPEGLTHIDAGAIVLDKKVLKMLPSGQRCSLEEEIYPRLIADGEMFAWVTSEPFYDMGSPAGLAALEEKLS